MALPVDEPARAALAHRVHPAVRTQPQPEEAFRARRVPVERLLPRPDVRVLRVPEAPLVHRPDAGAHPAADSAR